MKLRVLIADDEPLGRDRLRDFLLEESGIEIVAECADGTETLQAIHEKRPQVVFLDVQMPKLSGFGVLGALNGHRPAIIFVTAYAEYAVRAFEAHATDYLLKPFDRARLQQALQRARNGLRRTETHQTVDTIRDLLAELAKGPRPLARLTIRSGSSVSLVNAAEIDWICGADNYAELHVGKKVHLMRQTLTSLEAQLPKTQFMRISRSLIVNIDSIVELFARTHGDYLVLLRDGTRLTGTRKYRQDLLRLLDRRQ